MEKKIYTQINFQKVKHLTQIINAPRMFEVQGRQFTILLPVYFFPDSLRKPNRFNGYIIDKHAALLFLNVIHVTFSFFFFTYAYADRVFYIYIYVFCCRNSPLSPHYILNIKWFLVPPTNYIPTTKR